MDYVCEGPIHLAPFPEGTGEKSIPLCGFPALLDLKESQGSNLRESSTIRTGIISLFNHPPVHRWHKSGPFAKTANEPDLTPTAAPLSPYGQKIFESAPASKFSVLSWLNRHMSGSTNLNTFETSPTPIMSRDIANSPWGTNISGRISLCPHPRHGPPRLPTPALNRDGFTSIGWNLNLPNSTLAELARSLNADEQARAARFIRESDRRHFIAARGQLRAILALYTAQAAVSIRFSYNPQGKPALAMGEPRFNLSHSAGLGLLAVAAGQEVGVDVEEIARQVDYTNISKRYFASGEAAALLALPAADQRQAFFNCWTRKEAYIKARGLGMAIPLDSFEVSLAPGDPPRLSAPDAGLVAACARACRRVCRGAGCGRRNKGNQVLGLGRFINPYTRAVGFRLGMLGSRRSDLSHPGQPPGAHKTGRRPH